MLCILDDSLDLESVVRGASTATSHSVLLMPFPEVTALSACRSASCDDALSFDRWLFEFRRNGVLKCGAAVPPNSVFLVWRRPDDRLRAIFASFRGLTETRIDVALILAGPLEPDDSTVLKDIINCCSTPSSLVLSSIWYLGNGSDTAPIFEAPSRRDAVRRLVRVVLAEDDRFAESLGLFRGNSLLLDQKDFAAQTTPAWTSPTPSSTVTQREGVFSAFGLRSWEPWAEQFDADFVHRLACAVLQCEQHARKAELPVIQKTMTDAANTLFSTLATLGTPYDASAQGNCSLPLPEQLPPPPEFGFAVLEWFPSRESLSPAVLQAILNHERDLRGYQVGLRDALSGFSQQIRRNGRRVFNQALNDTRQFIGQTNGLLELWALLKDFFPRLAAAKSVACLTPSDPASYPHASICRRYCSEAQGRLATACAQMPSEKFIRRVQFAGGGLACLSVLMLVGHVSFPWVCIPAASGALLVWGLALYCRGVARRIVGELALQFQANGAELRSYFVAKLKWVLQKTQYAVENQLVGEVSAIGRKLALNHDHFYATGIVSDADPLSAARIVDMMTMYGVPESVAHSCRQDIERAVSLLISDALKEDAPSVGRIVAQELLDQIAAKLTASVVLPRPEMAAVKVEFLATAGQREQPPIPARLPTGVDSSHFARFYLLPSEYHDEVAWRSQLPFVGGHNIPSKVLLAFSLTEPLMISLRVALGFDEVKRSLAGPDART